MPTKAKIGVKSSSKLVCKPRRSHWTINRQHWGSRGWDISKCVTVWHNVVMRLCEVSKQVDKQILVKISSYFRHKDKARCNMMRGDPIFDAFILSSGWHCLDLPNPIWAQRFLLKKLTSISTWQENNLLLRESLVSLLTDIVKSASTVGKCFGVGSFKLRHKNMWVKNLESEKGGGEWGHN